MAKAMDIFFEMHRGLPREGPGRSEYTRKAFLMLPEMDEPRILDVGCGPGGQTLELARSSRGQVTGVDTHQPYLDRLSKEIEQAGLSRRVRALNCSVFELEFPGQSFEIVWAEGSIYIIGFDRGLEEWRRLIKPGGFLVVNELTWLHPDPPKEPRDYWREFYPAMRTVSENLEAIRSRSYDLIGYFVLPKDAWWVEYYGPLEARIAELRQKYGEDLEALGILDNEQREIDMFRKYHEWYGAVFFVMQRPPDG